MKLRVSIILTLLIGAFFILNAPQKYLYGWALDQIFEESHYTLSWEKGSVHLKNPSFNWPFKELKRSWKTKAAAAILEYMPLSIQNGSVYILGNSYKLNGTHSFQSSDLTLSLSGEPLVHLTTLDQDTHTWIFSNTPLSFLKPFFPLKEFSGIIVKGSINNALYGELLVEDLTYSENGFTLSVPKAQVEFYGSEANVLGFDVDLSFNQEPLWTLNPLPLKIQLQNDLAFAIPPCSVQFIDHRLQASAILKKTEVRGQLKPAKIDRLCFEKSSIIPLNEKSPLKTGHFTVCEYQKGHPSSFVLQGEEVCIEMNIDQEKTFEVQFSKEFMKQFQLHQLPLKKMIGQLNKENGMWTLDALMENGSFHASLSSLLLPKMELNEAFFHFDEWAIEKGPTFTNVELHFSPSLQWKAHYETLSFQGTGTHECLDFKGEGSLSSLRKLLSEGDSSIPFSNCPVEGSCILSEGHFDKGKISILGLIENAELGPVHHISSKFKFENDRFFALNDLTGSFELHGKEFQIFSPLIHLNEHVEFDGWIADESQDFLRLSGVGSFTKEGLHLSFDKNKTHLLNIVPKVFSMTLENWTSVKHLDFKGSGPFKTPFFEDLNRWTQHEDWDIALFYRSNEPGSYFEIKKGPLFIDGTMNELTMLQIQYFSLELPSLSASAKGGIDLKNLIVQLDPLTFKVDFSNSIEMTHLPLNGLFKAKGMMKATLNSSESFLQIYPEGLSFGILSIPNSPFELRQKGDEIAFRCNFLLNSNLLDRFDCLLNRQGLQANGHSISFSIGSTHFAVDKAGFHLKGRHTPAFSFIDPLETQVEIAKAFLPFQLPQIKGGTLHIDQGHCSISDTEIFGKEIDKVDFEFESLNNGNLQLKQISLKNDGERIQIDAAKLMFRNNRLQKVECPTLSGENISLNPLLISKLSVENFESEWPFKTFQGEGRIAFNNLLPLIAKSVNREELQELSHIDTKWFLPNQGEFSFEASNERFLLSDLKDCYSSGKMIRFELNQDLTEASVDWNGIFSLPLKLKPQHLSFKWSELFTLKIQGTLNAPQLEVKKR